MASLTLVLSTVLSAALLSCSTEKFADGDKKIDPITEEKRSSRHREAYQFNWDGCDTGNQEFISSNADDARAQLCAALQDSSLNKRCAESMRKDLFESKCAGKTWNPTK
jgi:hypothetical protein